MKIIRLIVSLVVTVGLTYALNTKFGVVPPLGKFLDPVNGFWANAESAPHIQKRISIPGLKQPVQIYYDDLLIPHIFAEDVEDLVLAQGYVHAYHRLWQMEFQTHAAAGRVSELIGRGALDYDRGQRRKGMVFGAEKYSDNLDASSRSLIEQYAKGVNYFINNLDYSSYPFEYKLMGYAPEEWTPLKSALLLNYMADMLNSHERDLENTNFKSLYGREMFDLIYPDIDNYQDPVVNRSGLWDFDPIIKEHIANNALPEDGTTAFNLIPKPDPGNGSNNWAVSGAKSATGHPILCNDMHLGLNMPALWFYNQLNTKNMNVMGHSLPGTPMVITGFTDSIAWGFTNAQRDLADWYLIKFEDESHDRYLLDGIYQPTEKVIEEIKIAGENSFYDTVVYTIFGPVMYDNSFRETSEKKGYARRWIGHDPSSSFKAFHLLNKAKNFEDYMEALDNFDSPAQNIIFASVQGDIAHRVQGKYPLKAFEEGKFLLDGTKSENNWSEYIPPRQNAFWKNPERGFVASANQHPADSTYPYYVTSTVYEAYRNRRINDVLRANNSITIEDMKNLHYDNFSTKAKESLGTMLQFLDNAQLSEEGFEVAKKLKNWNYYFDADSEEAVYFTNWYRNAYRKTWDEIKNRTLAYPSNYSFVNLMNNDPENIFFDDQSTDNIETATEIVQSSFKDMLEDLKDWSEENGKIGWSNYKKTYVQHLSRQRPLGVYEINSGGAGGDVVNATGSNHGPSQRIIVELDPDGVKAWGHYPGGQSGNPGSRYYDNMVESWATGKYFELMLFTDPEASEESIIYSQTIEPGN